MIRRADVDVPSTRLGWTELLLEAGVIEDGHELCGPAWRRDSEAGVERLTLVVRGPTALRVVHHLAGALGLRAVDRIPPEQRGILVILRDALSPLPGTISCDVLIPRPIVAVDRIWRAASREIASHVRSVTLRCGPLGRQGTIVSLLVAPCGESADELAAVVESVGMRLAS